MPGLPIDGGFDVLGYELALRPDVAHRTVEGVETLRLRSLEDGLSTLSFSGNALTVDGARQAGGRLWIDLPRPLRRGETYTLRLTYRGTPGRGLTWGERSVHSAYSTCDWMVCDQDRPGDTATLKLKVTAPGLKTITAPRDGGAYAPFMFGFAAGPFAEARVGRGLTVLSDAATPADLAALFAPTDAMRRFFEAKAGVALPRYAQVLTAGSEAQEAAGVSFVGRPELYPILTTPDEDWVIAHEMAHQWWGVAVACADFSHFWLNEGMATYMTAVWKQHRWGQAAYERELAIARTRWGRARAQGVDRPIAWPGDYPSLSLKRAIVYSKGMLFLDALRAEVGERAFWAGVRGYTRRFVGRTATSQDFQREMERAAGRDLKPIFQTWVYGAPAAPGA